MVGGHLTHTHGWLHIQTQIKLLVKAQVAVTQKVNGVDDASELGGGENGEADRGGSTAQSRHSLKDNHVTILDVTYNQHPSLLFRLRESRGMGFPALLTILHIMGHKCTSASGKTYIH